MIIRGQELAVESPPSDLDDLIARRLFDLTTWLPAPTHDEDPADIFVDLAAQSEAWRGALARAGAAVLDRWVAESLARDAAYVVPVGELCYLMARIGSHAALGPLRRLAGDRQATGMIAPGEDLRLRALRALVGLLGTVDRVTATEYRGVLFEALAEPRLAVTSASGLIGLWPEERETFLRMLPDTIERGELLDVAIQIAFRRHQ